MAFYKRIKNLEIQTKKTTNKQNQSTTTKLTHCQIIKYYNRKKYNCLFTSSPVFIVVPKQISPNDPDPIFRPNRYLLPTRSSIAIDLYLLMLHTHTHCFIFRFIFGCLLFYPNCNKDKIKLKPISKNSTYTTQLKFCQLGFDRLFVVVVFYVLSVQLFEITIAKLSINAFALSPNAEENAKQQKIKNSQTEKKLQQMSQNNYSK